jgi:glucosylceramidase
VVTVNSRTHRVAFGLPYYQLGHVSRFLEPGAVRVDSTHFVAYPLAGATAGLDDVAFLNPDGSEVLVAYDNTKRPIGFAVHWRSLSFSYKLPAGAMVTFVWSGR